MDTVNHLLAYLRNLEQEDILILNGKLILVKPATEEDIKRVSNREKS